MTPSEFSLALATTEPHCGYKVLFYWMEHIRVRRKTVLMHFIYWK